MNAKHLLILASAFICNSLAAQKSQQKTTAFAITGVEKGSQRWTEVRLIDLQTGEEVKTVYESTKESPVHNARTGKAVVKKDASTSLQGTKKPVTFNADMKDGDVIIIRRDNNNAVTILQENSRDENNFIKERRKLVFACRNESTDKPFSTKSAALAYDKKHDRLYYTPMGINQLRYIDLKSKDSKIFYFEDEAFGNVAGLRDVNNQITRMAFASDGNGYALTNNSEHLIRFTTNKKAQITDLGSLQDDAANGEKSIHDHSGFGGDMVADDKNNLYLITAHRDVYKISIKEMTAKYLGAIKGLPRGYTTNGAAVEKGSTIIISSANNTLGYYKFDLKTLTAEKISAAESVYTASDLANANLLSNKQEDDKKEVAEAPLVEKRPGVDPELKVSYKMSTYPNPVAKGDALYLRFNDFPYGRYHLQFMDLAGKLIRTENVNIGGKMQLHLLQLPKSLSQGNYVVKVIGENNKDKVLATEQIVVK